jgi:hypothetical protein
MTIAKHKPTEVAPKIKAAISVLLHQEQYNLQEAAMAAGVTAERLRNSLAMPHVRRWMRERRRIEIELLCQGNAAALRKVRDTSENGMAVCQAVAKAEQIRAKFHEEDNAPGSGARQLLPGLIIQIGSNVRIEPQSPQRLAGARTVLEAGAYERGPDPDEDLVDNFADDEALDAPPPPVRATVKPAVRRKPRRASDVPADVAGHSGGVEPDLGRPSYRRAASLLLLLPPPVWNRCGIRFHRQADGLDNC